MYIQGIQQMGEDGMYSVCGFSSFDHSLIKYIQIYDRYMMLCLVHYLYRDVKQMFATEWLIELNYNTCYTYDRVKFCE